MDFEEEWRRGRGDQGGINSPVTIVEGRDGDRRGGPTINLEDYTDYVLRKFQQEREWGQKAGTWNNGPYYNEHDRGGRGWYGDMRFGVTSSTADTPLKAIGATPIDAQYLLTAGLVCKVGAAGAGTITLTITYYDVLAGSTVVTLTQSLAATGQVHTGPTPIIILGGSAVTISVANGGTYLTATYDAFVALQKLG
jgi:hypothetical protein